MTDFQSLFTEFVLQNSHHISDIVYKASMGEGGTIHDMIVSIAKETGKEGKELTIHTLFLCLAMAVVVDNKEATEHYFRRLNELLY